MSGSSLGIRKFDIQNMGNNKTVLIIGKRGSGKSYLTKDILYHRRDVGLAVVFSPTEEMNEFFGEFIPKIFIHHAYDPAIMAQLERRQVGLIKKNKRNPEANIDDRAIIVLDDCMADAQDWRNDKYVKRCLFNWRHAQVDLSIITLQSPVGTLGPEKRDQFDYVFLFYTPSFIQKEKIYKHYASIFPTKQMFYNAFDILTEDHGCLVIKNTGNKTNKLQDIVFWYKAEDHGDFKFGPQAVWDWANEMTKDDEEEEDDEVDLSGFNKVNTKNGGDITIKKLD